MAKRGRKPKGQTIDQLDAALRSQIDEAIRSHADESAASIYRRFGLAQRGLVFGTFARHVTTIRRAEAGRRLDAPRPAPADERAMIQELRRRVFGEALARLDAGDAKLYETVGLLGKLQEFDRLDIEREANQRASEKHGEWRREVQAKLVRAKAEADAKLDRMALEKGIPGDVAERIKDLFGVKV